MTRLNSINTVDVLNSDLDKFQLERANLLKLYDSKPKTAEEGDEIRYSVLKDFCDVIKGILEVWDFENISSINFDTSYKIFDIQIGNKNRKAFGKGYRAILYSAFVIALMEYCNERGLPNSGNIVLDSPLTTFQGKEVDSINEEITKDIENAFFDDLATTQSDIQIIIFDNKDPMNSIKEKINYIHFTKNKTVGRYGFFPI